MSITALEKVIHAIPPVKFNAALVMKNEYCPNFLDTSVKMFHQQEFPTAEASGVNIAIVGRTSIDVLSVEIAAK
jgi:hypothetical protein